MSRRLVVALFLLIVTPQLAHAIPAFARKYGVSCALCHNPIPRLTPFGEQFAENGFELAVGENRDTIATGDPLLTLNRVFGLGARIDAYQRMLTHKAAGDAGLDQQVPYTVKIMSGGKIAEKVSYYMYFLVAERGEIAGLEDAYVQFTDVGGSGVNLMLGQFQVSDPLFKRELRLPFEDYQPYRVRVGLARPDLTYERGVMATWTSSQGLSLVAEVVNGQGLDAATASRQYDRNARQNFVLRASQDVGPVRLGVFGYYGEEGIGSATDHIRMFGPDATVPIAKVGELNLQAYRRWDSDPFLSTCSVLEPCGGWAATPVATSVDAGFAEVVLWPTGPAGRWFVTGLFNFIEADHPVVSLRMGEQESTAGYLQRYRTTSLGLHYVFRRNVRMVTEGSWDTDREQGRLVTGFTIGF